MKKENLGVKACFELTKEGILEIRNKKAILTEKGKIEALKIWLLMRHAENMEETQRIKKDEV